MVSALSDVDDRVTGLRAGGDDYLVKPFAPTELIARLEVMLRRSRRAESAELVIRVARPGASIWSSARRCAAGGASSCCRWNSACWSS